VFLGEDRIADVCAWQASCIVHFLPHCMWCHGQSKLQEASCYRERHRLCMVSHPCWHQV